MAFRLENLIPLPMADLPFRGSDLWEKESFEFIRGQNYLVEAASGKGKTSLLSILYGLRKDYKGSLYIDDINARELNEKKWSAYRKNRFSYIFQGLELFDELSAWENLQLKNKITGWKSREQIVSMAEKLDVAGFLEKKVSILSFGQKQRFAIIRALCQPFEFLLADECFSHIDKQHADHALDLIRSESQLQNAGFILTSLGNNGFTLQNRITL